MPHKFNAARRHKFDKAQYRVINWAEYNESLRQGGNLTIWMCCNFQKEAGERWVGSTIRRLMQPPRSMQQRSYMAPRRMSFRTQRSARMLGEDDSISLDEMIEYKHSTRMELADLILDDLIPAAPRRGGLARRAAAVLDSWDREADADSGGAVRFQAWASEVGGGTRDLRDPVG